MNGMVSHLLSFLGGAGAVGAVVLWGLRNLDKLERLVAWFYRTFSWMCRKWEYGNVASNVQTAVNTVGEALTKEAGDVLPHAMKIEWARTAQTVEAFLRNGEIIVTMDYSPNRDRNLVVGTLAYLGKGLLPRARPYVDRVLMTAIDFTVAKRIFTSARQRQLAVQFFFDSYLQPEMEKESQLRDDCTVLDRLQEAGFFSRVLLPQLHRMGNEAFPATPTEATWRESRDFSKFLEGIVTKAKGEDVAGGLTFARSRIRASVMLVARKETKAWGTWPYARRVEIELDRGVDYLYICARGPDNISLAEEIANEQERDGRLEVLQQHRFLQTIDGKEYGVVCIACALKLLMRSRAACEPSSTVYRLLEEYIEELQNGQIEVVALARQPGVRSKVAVRSLVDGVDPLRCCTEQARLEAVKSALGNEELEFIQWSNDPESLIVASLTPLDPGQVLEVRIDVEKREATVKVDGWKARRKALGRGDQNVSCARELTGWQITVVEGLPAEKEPTG